MASGTAAAGGSEGDGVWDGSGVGDGISVGDGSGEPLFVILSASGTAAASGAVVASFSGTVAASLYLWFFPGSKGGGVGVCSTVK